MTMTPAEFREARRTLGLTQAELAALFGWRPDHVSRTEKGHAPIMPVTAIAMRALLAGVR